jgi:hypothetical protein
MTNEDFSNGFDTLLNSYSTVAEFGSDTSSRDIRLDEYEKSQFLTMAQDGVITDLYNGRNPLGESFEETEQLRRYLSNLVREDSLEPIENSSGTPIGISSSSTFFSLPTDLMYITYEAVKLSSGKCDGLTNIEVVPVRQDEYHRIKKNPFRGPTDRRALRLDLADGVVEIVCKYPVASYYLRYLVKAAPIILIDLPDGQTINEESLASECELPEVLHQRILERAVLMALQSRGYRVPQSTQEQV